MWPRLALNSQGSSCLSLLRTGLTGPTALFLNWNIPAAAGGAAFYLLGPHRDHCARPTHRWQNRTGSVRSHSSSQRKSSTLSTTAPLGHRARGKRGGPGDCPGPGWAGRGSSPGPSTPAQSWAGFHLCLSWGTESPYVGRAGLGLQVLLPLPLRAGLPGVRHHPQP